MSERRQKLTEAEKDYLQKKTERACKILNPARYSVGHTTITVTNRGHIIDLFGNLTLGDGPVNNYCGNKLRTARIRIETTAIARTAGSPPPSNTKVLRVYVIGFKGQGSPPEDFLFKLQGGPGGVGEPWRERKLQTWDQFQVYHNDIQTINRLGNKTEDRSWSDTTDYAWKTTIEPSTNVPTNASYARGAMGLAVISNHTANDAEAPRLQVYYEVVFYC